MGNRLFAEINRRDIPPLHTQEDAPDPIIYLEMRLMHVPWRWYVSELEIEEDGDIIFFGFIIGNFKEWGYFRLSELEDADCPLLVNYDFKPMPFSELKKEYNL